MEETRISTFYHQLFIPISNRCRACINNRRACTSTINSPFYKVSPKEKTRIVLSDDTDIPLTCLLKALSYTYIIKIEFILGYNYVFPLSLGFAHGLDDISGKNYVYINFGSTY